MNADEGTHDIPDELRDAWNDLSEKERRELAHTWDVLGRVREDHPDPGAAEQRLMSAIAASTSGTDRRSQRPRHRHWGRLAAAAVVVMAAGLALYFAIQPSGDPQATAATREFMLLLHGEPLVRYPEEEHAQIIGEYVAWARELGESGRFVAGNELAPGGRILAVKSGNVRTQQIEDVENAVSGYFIVAAADLDEAARIAADCPHLKYDGTVEVRQIGTN